MAAAGTEGRPKVQVLVRLTPEQRAEFEGLAKRHERTLAQEARVALRQYVERERASA